MAASLISEFRRLSSTSPSPSDYFTDSTNTLNVKSDVVLVVGKEKFYCHRLLLSLVSPVFTRMFDGEFKEHDAREIILEGKSSPSILELLKYIYPQFNGQITDHNVEDFLRLADEYMIEHLKQPCKNLLIKQLQSFKFVSLPTKQKLEQPSLRSKCFHASDSALDSPPHPDEDSVSHNNTNRVHIMRRLTTSTRQHSTKSTSSYFKSNEKNSSPINTQPRYILFLDKTQLPCFYDGHHTRIPFTATEVELWLHRLRILYQIDKGRNYGEVIDYILSILQFVSATLLHSLAHITVETCSIDELMLNDMARARMFMLEEWTSDGDPYRRVCLTDSYRTMSPTILAATAQQTVATSTNTTGNDEHNRSQEAVFISSDLETADLVYQFTVANSY